MTEDEDGETPRKTVRVPHRRWNLFRKIAAEEGTNVSAKLNAYMQTEIDRHEEDKRA